MDWCIYVGNAAAKNFVIGLNEGIWGHKVIFNGVPVEEIKVGDKIYFVHHLRKLKGLLGETRDGFPRVPVEELFGVIDSLVVAEVTQDYYQDSSTVWPDDMYPHRFKFKVTERYDIINFGLEFFQYEFVEAVRHSLLRKGLPIPLHNEGSDQFYLEPDFDDLSVTEGKPLLVAHTRRERSAEVTKAKKQQVLAESGKLECEGCGFDFQQTYGERGRGFMECHHLNPLSDTEEGRVTKLHDLALVCSNCHRMIHRSRPWLSIEELRETLSSQ